MVTKMQPLQQYVQLNQREMIQRFQKSQRWAAGGDE